MKEISVIVPVYNQEIFLGRCLRSLLAQDFDRKDYEIVVADDASTDRSRHTMGVFADEIVQVHLEENQGLPAALNTALDVAQGRFIVRVDSDDYVNTRFLSALHMVLDANDEIDAVACDYLLVSNSEEVLGRGNATEAPIACGILFRFEHLEELGFYNEEFRMHEDLELRRRFLLERAIFHLPVPLYRYRRHESNMTNDAELSQRYMNKLSTDESSWRNEVVGDML